MTVSRLPGGVAANDSIGRTVVTAEAIDQRVRELAAKVSRDYDGKDVLLLGILKGAVFFLSDLMRQMDVHAEVDFMAISSYGSATQSSGVVRILKDLDRPIEGRHVLIVEDIVDSGLTLRYLLGNLQGRNPASLEVCALLSKREARVVDVPVEYVGFEIPNEFVIGYGLDYDERYRSLPYVATLELG
jgi:hypoxanthine phosphoribosyltransferase